AVLLAISGLAVVYLRGRNQTSAPPELHVELTTPPTADPFSISLSRDGRSIAFVASSEGQQRLWVRALDTPVAHALDGTDGAGFPSWSPTGQSIGFFAAGKLKRVDLSGGSPRALADAPGGRGGAWGSDDVILFAPSTVTPLHEVLASGSVDKPAT